MEGSRKILIIEDEALVARELQARLRKMNYTVVGIAASTAPAIQLARDTQPDLLLTDIHLKDGGDGIDTAQLIQQERYVPVVFLTAYSDQETVARAKAASPYGYIIKPVDNRELEIAIDIALYKAELEKELRTTRDLLKTALACIGDCLLFVNSRGVIRDMNLEARTLLLAGRDKDYNWHQLWQEILQPGEGLGERIVEALHSSTLVRLPPFVIQRVVGQCLVDGVIGPQADGHVIILRELSVLSDEVESLPTSAELLARLTPDNINAGDSFFVQVLLSPDHLSDFAVTEDEREQVLREIEEVLHHFLRATDLTSRYSNQVVAVSLPYTAVEEGEAITRLVLKDLAGQHFLGGRVSLTFSAGLADSGPGDQQPFELFRRAGWALNIAREAGGDRVITWRPESEPGTGEAPDRVEQNYRNMLLLWNLMNLSGRSGDLTGLIQNTAAHLVKSFNFDYVALLGLQAGGSLSCHGGLDRDATEIPDAGSLELDAVTFTALLSGLQQNHFVPIMLDDLTGLFLQVADQPLVMVFKHTFVLEGEDLDFLRSVVSYLAAPISSFLVQSEQTTPDSQSSQLEQKLIYSAPGMSNLMEQAKVVAETDATVLVIGESGTGKELVAKSIHEASKRVGKPFVIVDCGAVVESLIESELFGHQRGAFTGADRDYSGRLNEADGGTLLLDEVGELPPDVQVKLLRFVQEREFTPVGGNQYQSVDIRIIAATNRDLPQLVKSGLFREDLYYRLNVITLNVPPLRERSVDIPAIANHFLAYYAEEYRKPVRGFTRDANTALVQYQWPGNIRELRNVIQRSVILSKDIEISNIHLGLFASSEESSEVESAIKVAGGLSDADIKRIRELISRFVKDCLVLDTTPPLGKWLEEDLVMAAMQRTGSNSQQAADLLGIPATTMRRKHQRSTLEQSQRPQDWHPLRQLMDDLLNDNHKGNLVEQVSLVAAGVINEEVQHSRLTGAQLMGVSVPTYRRLLSSLSTS